MNNLDDLEPRRRTPKIGYSYPSNQSRHGPAPLASFEDLPSDDQASPEDEQRDLSPDQLVIDRALENDSLDLLNASPTKTLTPVSVRSPFDRSPDPPRKNSETGSQQTLTPVGDTLSPESAKNGFSGSLTTPSGSRSGSAASQEGRDLRKASQGSQLAVPGNDGVASKSPSPSSKRKGSWTDIFFKGRSRSKSPNERPTPESPQGSPGQEDGTKRKKSIFSFLKKGRKPSASEEASKESLQTLSPERSHSPSHAAAWKAVQELHHQPTSEQTAWKAVQELHHQPGPLEIAWKTVQELHHQPGPHEIAWKAVQELHRRSGPNEIDWKTVQELHNQPGSQEAAWKTIQNLHHRPGPKEVDSNTIQELNQPDKSNPVEVVVNINHKDQDYQPGSQEAWKIIQNLHHAPGEQEVAWKTIQELHHAPGEQEVAWKQIQDLHHQPGPDQVAEQVAWRAVAALHHQDSETNPCRKLSTPRVSVTDTTKAEACVEVLFRDNEDNGPKESQQDIMGILEAEQRDDERNISDITLNRTLKRRSDSIDDEVQSLPGTLPSNRNRSQQESSLEKESSRKAAGVQGTAIATIERRPDDDKGNSSESDTGNTDDSTLKGIKDTSCTDTIEDDTEAATLLNQESVEYDEGSSYETVEFKRPLPPPSNILLPRDRRQELAKLAPVDRPRSTTPIGIAPLEAFIRRASLSPDPTAERIRLSLPGEQFLASARAKSPRKSNPQIWLDFCEKGLQSPKTNSRKERFKYTLKEGEIEFGHQEASTISVPITSNDAFTPVTDAPLTPVTPLDEVGECAKWNFGDSFDPNSLLAKVVANVPQECGKCDCRFFKGLSFGGSVASLGTCSPCEPLDPTDPESESLIPSSRTLNSSLLCVGTSEEQQPLVSPNPCSCDCHSCAELASALWRKTSLHKQDSVSSDISSASSRLIGSSSSNNSLKCTLDASGLAS